MHDYLEKETGGSFHKKILSVWKFELETAHCLLVQGVTLVAAVCNGEEVQK